MSKSLRHNNFIDFDGTSESVCLFDIFEFPFLAWLLKLVMTCRIHKSGPILHLSMGVRLVVQVGFRDLKLFLAGKLEILCSKEISSDEESSEEDEIYDVSIPLYQREVNYFS